jgi:hypothetical protein
MSTGKEVSMPWILVYVLAIAVTRLMRRLGAKLPQRGLCARCSFVHMQFGATGRNAVFCTFGGGVRPVMIDVLYCTDYRDRNVASLPVRIGFVPEIQGVEAEA